MKARRTPAACVRWPVKLMIPVGFASGRPAGHLRDHQMHPRADDRATSANSPTRSRCNDRSPDALHGPADVPGADLLHGDRLSGGILARRCRPVLRPHRDRTRADRAGLSRQPHLPAVLGAFERLAAGDPVLHLHGRDPRTLRPRRRSARRLRPAVRRPSRRPLLCGHPRRRDPRRDHRHGRGVGDRHGPDLAAGDDALRLQRAPRDRRHRRVGHHHAAHSAVAGADRARRPARQIAGRHVYRRDRGAASSRCCCSPAGC